MDNNNKIAEHMMKKQQQSNYSCDVLIIGGGSAGLRAAIEAHDAGANVLIISKSKRGEPHTTLARGGINAAPRTMDPEDNWVVLLFLSICIWIVPPSGISEVRSFPYKDSSHIYYKHRLMKVK